LFRDGIAFRTARACSSFIIFINPCRLNITPNTSEAVKVKLVLVVPTPLQEFGTPVHAFIKIGSSVLGTFGRRNVGALTGPVGTITAAFPAITAKQIVFAPICIFELFGTAVATVVSGRGGRANGRTSSLTGDCTHSSKPPNDISECTNII